MFRKREIVTSHTKEDVISTLTTQIRNSFLTDTVDDSCFSLHRSVTNAPNGNRDFTNFKFVGTVHEFEGKSIIHYRVTPPILFVVLLIVLLGSIVYAAIDILFRGGSALFLFVDFILTASIYGFTAWECSECVKSFKSLFS